MGPGVQTWSTTLETPLRIIYFLAFTPPAEIDDMSPEGSLTALWIEWEKPGSQSVHWPIQVNVKR